MRTRTTLAAATVIVVFGLGACGGDDSGDDGASATTDFAVADLEGLSFAPDDVANMEYKPKRSGPGAFAHDNPDVAAEFEDLGMEADHLSQFFATSRDSELFFVESIAFLFEDEAAATSAVKPLKESNLDNLAPADEIEAPADLGDQAFGIHGDFDGFPVYSFGWRVGDAVQVLTVAPSGKDPSPASTLALAEQLAAQADA